MLIGWISDCFLSEGFVGGGEITESELIKRRHNSIAVSKITKDNFNTNCDFYILNNFRTLSKIQLEYLVYEKRYGIAWRDIIDTPHDDFIPILFANSKFDIFLSPLHEYSFFEKFDLSYASEHTKQSFIIPPYFDCKKYINKNRMPDKDVCWLGHIQHHKGIDDVLLWARDNDVMVDFYGGGNQQIVNQLLESKYARYLGHGDPVEVFKQYESFIHLPDKVEAFGRSCFEAYLSGCKIIRNDKVGMYSYPLLDLIDDITEWIESSPKKFWNVVFNSLR
tara:strand:- start:4292 stop:5125 length:834 start_codon:yes stop_codon:yes gene_type:complete